MSANEKWSLAFVDAITASPTVRLNLCSGTRGPWNLRDGSRFDPPPLRRSMPSSLLTDGSIPNSTAYDNRTILLRLQLLSGGVQMDADPAAAQVQLLVRELDRPMNTLRLQAGTSAPVFFRTYRAGPDALEFDPINREVTVTLIAEPFALGLEETLSGTVVTNNPAVANGLFLDIPAPKGDVETPLTLTISNGVVGTGRRRSAFAVRRRGTPSATPLFLQAESMTLAANVTAPGADAAMSGSNYARISYTGNTTLIQRLSTPTRFPATASVDARGQYRVFARIRRNAVNDVHTIRLRHGGADAQITNATVTVPADSGPSAPTITMVDLGVIQIPSGYDPVERGGVELATEGVFLAVDTGRPFGSNTLDIDYLLFLPTEDQARTTYVDWPAAATVADFVLTGGQSPRAYARNAAGQLTSTQAPEIAGIGLMISPGVTNRLFFHRDVGMATALTGTGDSITATTTLTPSYFPRYVGGFRPPTT